MKKKKGTGMDYWQSYSDLMAALLLIFILIIAVALVQAKGQQQDLEKQGKELKKQQEELEEQRERLEKKGEEYIQLQKRLEETQKQLDKIIGIKAEIISSLNKQFEEQKLSISLDDKTGAIRLKSEILFDTEKSELLQNGKDYLNTFLPVYFRVLFSDAYKDYIAEIIVEGNCDSRGNYEDNLKLSQERARSVALYCKEWMEREVDAETMDDMLKLLNISGRSNKNLIYKDNGQENLDASRRVELKFRLKDEEMIEEMRKLMEEKQ